MNGPECANQRGFTLLEVLVAFSVLGVALALVLNVFTGGLRATAQVSAYQEATAYAQSLLAEARVQPLDVGETTGALPGGYRWRRTVAPYQWTAPEWQDQAPVRPLRVVVEVAWGSEARPRTVTLQGLRLTERL